MVSQNRRNLFFLLINFLASVAALIRTCQSMSILRLRRYRASSSYLPIWLRRYRTYVLRRYRASISYLPAAPPGIQDVLLRRYRVSSIYLPLLRRELDERPLRRYRASSSYLPAISVKLPWPLLRRYCSSSSYLLSYVPLERSIYFVGTALLAVTYLELISAGVREGFVGSALRAVTYR